MTWRRICFWDVAKHPEGKPIVAVHPVTGDPVLRRNLITFFPETGGADEALGDYLWKGQVGIDYSEEARAMSPLDPERVKVVSDQSFTLNPNFRDEATRGGRKHTVVKRWHPMNKKMTYDQEESGMNKDGSTGWSVTSPKAAGNFYVLDIFYTGAGVQDPPTTTNIGDFMVERTVYWHEK